MEPAQPCQGQTKALELISGVLVVFVKTAHSSPDFDPDAKNGQEEVLFINLETGTRLRMSSMFSVYGTLMSSDCNSSNPSKIKKEPKKKPATRSSWGGGGELELTSLRGPKLFFLVHFFYLYFSSRPHVQLFQPTSFPTSCQRKRERHLEKERVVVVVGVNTSIQHLLPRQEKRCVEKREGGGRGWVRWLGRGKYKSLRMWEGDL